MPIELNGNLYPLLDKLLDAREGPYPDPATAKASVSDNYKTQGLFAVIVDPNSPLGARLYWYQNNTTDLVPFTGNNSVLVFNTFSEFPTTGDANVIYIDKSTGIAYFYNSTSTPPDYFPTDGQSVAIYPTLAAFPLIGETDYVYIDNSTDKSYYWDTNLNKYVLLTGNQGKSAYEVWIDLGNEGTEQDFIDSLKGEPGDGITINGLNYVGDWIVLGPRSYLVGDVVVYLGSSYVTIFDHFDDGNITPDINPNWGLLTSKGAQGDIGGPGPPGAQGVPGEKGDPGEVGPAGLTWRGLWASGTSYVKDDAVGYDGSSWFCILATSGTTPPDQDTTHWALLALQGTKGDKGETGDKGADSTVPGPPGPQGPAGVLLTTITDNIDDVIIAPNTSENIEVVNGSRVLEGSIIYIDDVGYFTAVNVSGSTVSISNDFSEDTLTVPANPDFKLVIVTGPEGPIGPEGPAGDDGTSIIIKGTVSSSIDLQNIANPEVGDVWITQDDYHGWVYTGNDWVDLGPFQGPAGEDAIWNFRQAYDGGTAYEIGDIVTYEGQTWYRINANGGNVGDVPAEGTFWTLIAAKGADGAGTQTLQEVLTEGNTATDIDISLIGTSKITFNNGSKLQKGTTDSGNGGLGGIALKCSVDYELKWEAGRLYVMQQDGTEIREVRYNFTQIPTVNDDNTKGFVAGSRWILDNGETWVCSDPNTGTAIWTIENAAAGINYYVAGGTNTYTVGAITTYNIGDVYTIKFTNANSGVSTLNGESLKNTKTGTTLVSGDIRTNETHLLVYDGTDFQVLTIGPNTSANSGGGGSGSGAIIDMGNRIDGLELVDLGARI